MFWGGRTASLILITVALLSLFYIMELQSSGGRGNTFVSNSVLHAVLSLVKRGLYIKWSLTTAFNRVKSFHFIINKINYYEYPGL